MGTMRALRVHRLGEPQDVLRLEMIESPRPGPGQVLVEVEAAGLNFPDILLCQGRYQEKPALPFTPGFELMGQVIEVGPGVESLRPGQRVIGMPGFESGCLAEQSVAPADTLFPIPDSLDAAAGAAMFVTYQTGYLALHRRAALRAGETLLVHAGAGGVGSAAIQLGRAAGARVIATAGGSDKARVCRELGADVAIDYLAEDFVDAVKRTTDGRGADVIYDPVGGEVFDRSRRCVSFEGRILIIGFTSGSFAAAPTNHLLVKNYAVVGVHWALYRQRIPGVQAQIHDALMQLHREGTIKPLIFREISLAEVPELLTMIGDRRSWGKVVCRIRRAN